MFEIAADSKSESVVMTEFEIGNIKCLQKVNESDPRKRVSVGVSRSLLYFVTHLSETRQYNVFVVVVI